jgi:hypothetical protein
MAYFLIICKKNLPLMAFAVDRDNGAALAPTTTAISAKNVEKAQNDRISGRLAAGSSSA